MAFENGVDWRPVDPQLRGRHASFSSALQAVFADLSTEKSAFFDSLVDMWPALFPGLPARPGQWESGTLFLYVPNAPTNFATRPRLPSVKRKLLSLPGAPKKLDVKLEIRR